MVIKSMLADFLNIKLRIELSSRRNVMEVKNDIFGLSMGPRLFKSMRLLDRDRPEHFETE